ncbi:excalibur calcium-binding domain-containing protein [Streptomyces sp. GXMU-J15]|uniref:Excalibur calcium-binding domain-containing protein n=1 Tax=Streptomyces fuscus TaxID=3048495 RepID=A0ABT7J0S8_9ACTN|nr:MULTISPECIES: excalibur calcium-binding domain-containing protein [Streptomyces]MDL2077937.1 excalibur calcium-binding domain-containing protein [Streptomyces fuscus]SBT88370.1 LPXTG-motif cell wall anchor domain-containing protein [Streptomyces sp. DI166]
MRHVRTSTALAVAALALTLSSGAAVAHDGDHPFANCAEAYENGYANIAEGDEHYGGHLDRDKDGIGCDQPPADFEPATDADAAEDTAEDDRTDLAATGGNSATPYFAGGGAAVLLAGAGVLLTVRRRRGATQ